MNTILTFVLRHSLGDCTNNGLTSKEDSIILHYGEGLDLDMIPDDELVLRKSPMGRAKELRSSSFYRKIRSPFNGRWKLDLHIRF